MKYLADENFPHVAAQTLQALGWDIVEAVMTPKLRQLDDVSELLLYAKRTQRILLSADMFEDRATRTRLRENLRRTKRGKVISVSGGPQRSWRKIVGKLLYHQEEFESFFSAGHGICQIGSLRPETLRLQRPEKIDTVHQRRVTQGEAYVRKPRQPRLRPIRKRPWAPPAASAELLDDT